MRRLSEMARNLASDIIELAVVFVVQSLVLPLVFLWLLLQLLKALLRLPMAAMHWSDPPNRHGGADQ